MYLSSYNQGLMRNPDIVNLMYSENLTYAPLARAQIIHPTLSEVVAQAFGNLRPTNFELEHHHEHSG